jgi:hypothetical protein
MRLTPERLTDRGQDRLKSGKLAFYEEFAARNRSVASALTLNPAIAIWQDWTIAGTVIDRLPNSLAFIRLPIFIFCGQTVSFEQFKRGHEHGIAEPKKESGDNSQSHQKEVGGSRGRLLILRGLSSGKVVDQSRSNHDRVRHRQFCWHDWRF